MIEYKGYDMRSLAERRWARLFDVFGIHWVYEPKVFKTDVGGYLPDFYFPIADFFAEVKGPTPSPEEVEKAQALERLTGKPVVFLHGRMEVFRGELFHGVISWRHVQFTTGEISEMLMDRKQYRLVSQMARCADDGDDPYSSMRYITSEWIQKRLGRAALEEKLRQVNGPITKQRLAKHTTKTAGDHMLCEFHRIVSPIEMR